MESSCEWQASGWQKKGMRIGKNKSTDLVLSNQGKHFVKRAGRNVC